MFDQKWTVGMIEEQQDRTITLYARWGKRRRNPKRRIRSRALAAGALLLAGDDNPFRDVRAIDWFYDDVLYAYDRGLITGTAYGEVFRPRDSFTRGMLLTILARHDGVNPRAPRGIRRAATGRRKTFRWGKKTPRGHLREEFALILYRLRTVPRQAGHRARRPLPLYGRGHSKRDSASRRAVGSRRGDFARR